MIVVKYAFHSRKSIIISKYASSFTQIGDIELTDNDLLYLFWIFV